jgi:hypothetical protein
MELATATNPFVDEGAYVSLPADARSSLDAAVNQIGKNITGMEGRCQQPRGFVRLYETVKSTKGSIGIVFGSAGDPDARHLRFG